MWETFTSFSSFQLSQHFPKSNKTTWNLHNIHKLQSSLQFSWRKPSAVILIPFSFALPLFTSLFVLMAAHPSTFHSLASQSQHWPCHSALADWRTLGLPVHLCPLGSLVRSLMGYYCDFLQVYNQFTNNKSLLQYILAQGKLRTKWTRWWDLLLWTATHTTNNFVFVFRQSQSSWCFHNLKGLQLAGKLKWTIFNNKIPKRYIHTVYCTYTLCQRFPHLICHFDLSFFVLHSEKCFEQMRNLLNANRTCRNWYSSRGLEGRPKLTFSYFGFFCKFWQVLLLIGNSLQVHIWKIKYRKLQKKIQVYEAIIDYHSYKHNLHVATT